MIIPNLLISVILTLSITECVYFSENSDLYINNALFVPTSDHVHNSKQERKIKPALQAHTGELIKLFSYVLKFIFTLGSDSV